MADSFMITEGDRSGVNTPDSLSKAESAMKAAAERAGKLKGAIPWGKTWKKEIEEIERSLNTAKFHLDKYVADKK